MGQTSSHFEGLVAILVVEVFLSFRASIFGYGPSSDQKLFSSDPVIP